MRLNFITQKYYLLHVANSVLNELFWLHFEDFYDKDDCLHHIICSPRHVAIAVYDHFNSKCAAFVVGAYIAVVMVCFNAFIFVYICLSFLLFSSAYFWRINVFIMKIIT